MRGGTYEDPSEMEEKKQRRRRLVFFTIFCFCLVSMLVLMVCVENMPRHKNVLAGPLIMLFLTLIYSVLAMNGCQPFAWLRRLTRKWMSPAIVVVRAALTRCPSCGKYPMRISVVRGNSMLDRHRSVTSCVCRCRRCRTSLRIMPNGVNANMKKVAG